MIICIVLQHSDQILLEKDVRLFLFKAEYNKETFRQKDTQYKELNNLNPVLLITSNISRGYI